MNIIIRNHKELYVIREYIANNSFTWNTDEENPALTKETY